MKTLSVAQLDQRQKGNDTQVKFNKITSQQINTQKHMQSGIGRAASTSMSQSNTTGMDTTSRLTQLGKALKRLLDPSEDTLLPGYCELIQLVKSSTVAAKEDRAEEEKAYYEAKISRFSKDRR